MPPIFKYEKCVIFYIKTVAFLKSKGITHIFNAAEGPGPGMVPALDPATLEGMQLIIKNVALSC